MNAWARARGAWLLLGASCAPAPSPSAPRAEPLAARAELAPHAEPTLRPARPDVSPQSVSARAPQTPEPGAAPPRLGPCLPTQRAELPRSIGNVTLGAPAPPAPEPALLADVCLWGPARGRASRGVVHTVEVWHNCDMDPETPACEDPRGLAEALKTAFATPYTTPRAGRVDGPYVFQSTEIELNLERLAGFEGGFTILRLLLIQRQSDAICHGSDGFAEFHRAFREAAARGQRARVAQAFAYPFKDEHRNLGVPPDQGPENYALSTNADLYRKYHHFFGKPGASKVPSFWPSEQIECRLEFDGYLDQAWLHGNMLAQRRKGVWKWVMNAYTP